MSAYEWYKRKYRQYERDRLRVNLSVDYNLTVYPYEFGTTPYKYAVYDDITAHVYYATDTHWKMKVVFFWVKNIWRWE